MDKGAQKDGSKTLNEFLNICAGFRQTGVFIAAMQFVARFRAYAPLNGFLIFAQRPDASFVASRNQWQRRFGRRLKEGARPIVILVPMGPVAFVYDVADTEGRPLPQYFTEPYKVKGVFADATWENTLCHCIEKDKFRVAFTKKSFLNGACVIRRGDQFSIEINEAFESDAMRYASLVHELAHVYCGHLGPDNSNGKNARWRSRLDIPHNRKEIEAETVAFLTASRMGLETKSIQYVGGYIRNPEEDLAGISLNTILEVTGIIEKMAEYSPALRTRQ